MANEYIIPHPNIPTADIGVPKLKEVTVKNNENFIELDRVARDAISRINELVGRIESMRHEHPYAPAVHEHGMSSISGLVDTLNSKAAATHYHDQYLTSVPQHYHDENDIQGLLASLEKKADLVHLHSIGDVIGLSVELSAKADNSYVEWLESNMAKLTQSDTPLVDGDPQSGEGVIGESDKAARADHRHPVNKTADVDNIKRDGNGTNGSPQIGSLYSYALTDHSHPLNYPSGKPTNVLAPDGNGTGDTPQFGDSNYYADLFHSHPLNVGTSGSPADVVKSSGSALLGSSGYYARQDHVHKLPVLATADIDKLDDELDELTDLISNNTESISNHETRISALEESGGDGTVKSVDGHIPDPSGNVVTIGDGEGSGQSGYAASDTHSHGVISRDGKVGLQYGGQYLSVDPFTGVISVYVRGSGNQITRANLGAVVDSFYADNLGYIEKLSAGWVKADANGKFVIAESSPATESALEEVRQDVAAAADAAATAQTTADTASAAASAAATAARGAQQTVDDAVEAIAIVEGNLETLTTTVTNLSGTVTNLSGQVDAISLALEQLIDVAIAQLDAEIEQAQADADQALQDAADAQGAAEGAQEDATDAQTRVGVIEGDYLTSDDLTNLITKNEIPQAFINAIPMTYGGTMEVGGRVGWDGTHITQQVRTLTVTAGLITGIGSWSTVQLIPSVQYSN